jgi:hypothetical protein
MTDVFSDLGVFLGLIASVIIIIGGGIAGYVYLSRLRFAGGKWNIRSVGFYPPSLTKNIKIERTDWQQALPGETLPLGTLSIGDPEGGELIPLEGLTRVALKRTGNPPAVALHFVITNPGVIPVAIKEVTFVVQRSDGSSRCEFGPAFFGKKEVPVNSTLPAGLPFDEYWGPIQIQPSSSTERRLVFVPKPDNVFEGLTAGEYECSIELKFERMFKLRRQKEKSRRIMFKFDAEEELVENWKSDKPVIVPYGLLRDIE